MKSNTLKLALLTALICPLLAQSAQIEKNAPRLFVPYKDLAAVVDPASKTVLMDRQAFAQLLAAAAATPVWVAARTSKQAKAANKWALSNFKTIQDEKEKTIKVEMGVVSGHRLS